MVKCPLFFILICDSKKTYKNKIYKEKSGHLATTNNFVTFCYFFAKMQVPLMENKAPLPPIIFEEDEDMNDGREAEYGYLFPFRNGCVGFSRDLTGDDIRQIPSGKSHTLLPMFAVCEDCRVYMNFYDGPNGHIGGGWACPICGAFMAENLAIRQLNREMEMIDEILSSPDDSEDMDE